VCAWFIRKFYNFSAAENNEKKKESQIDVNAPQATTRVGGEWEEGWKKKRKEITYKKNKKKTSTHFASMLNVALPLDTFCFHFPHAIFRAFVERFIKQLLACDVAAE